MAKKTNKKILLLAIHGMGDTKPDFAGLLWKQLKKKIGKKAWATIQARPIYYQNIFQDNQNTVFHRMKKEGNISWLRLRRFVLSGFSDALGLERNPPIKGVPPYEQIQKKIWDELSCCFSMYNKLPVIIIAQSLGCYIISNYIWDAQRTSPSQQSIFRKDGKGHGRNSEYDKFCRLKSFRTLITTGCNIPIFVAGYPQKEIKPISTRKPGYLFDWHNFYDEDDVLGWPLKPLSPSYKTLEGLEDHAINAGSGSWRRCLMSLTPLSHKNYWSDNDVINFLAKKLKNP